jgi:5-methylcytosine-specific restriction endonuclease McrA
VSDTLVLNAAWEPVRTIKWEDAFTLLFNQGEGRHQVKTKAHVIEYYDDRRVHSATEEWRVPSIIRLADTFVRHRKMVRFSRDAIYTRDRGTCQYCNVRTGRDEFTLDHVVPKSRGGKTTWTNTVVACIECNQRKGDATLHRCGLKLRKTPVKPDQLFGQYHVRWRRDMPSAWRAYLRDNLYWFGELDNDNVG